MSKVFLGGTCNESTWRDELIKKLKIDYFNPVVDDWNEEAQKKEIYEREHCDFCLYVITPKMTGMYSIAEVIDDSNKRPNKTIFCYLETDYPDRFSKGQLKSLDMVAKMIERNGAKFLPSIDYVATYLNSFADKEYNIAESVSSLEVLATNVDVFHCVADTQDHANKVESYIDILVNELNRIKRIHDKSKMSDPEVGYFAKYGPMLKNLTYGSEEYKQCLKEMQPGTQHHYENNPHHPEYHKNGIKDMTLINIVEMICDWYAASQRNANGNIFDSMQKNKERFKISDDLYLILENTIKFIKSKE
jgi:hypothetical protein